MFKELEQDIYLIANLLKDLSLPVKSASSLKMKYTLLWATFSLNVVMFGQKLLTLSYSRPGKIDNN